MFWFHLSACGEMSDPKAGTGYSLRCTPPAYPWKKDSAGELPLGDCSQCLELKEKKIKNFLLPVSGLLTFCGKTPPLYPTVQRWVIDSPYLLKSLSRFIV
ncbi:hypothetical protein QUB37_14185 [Microcoleus sp. AT3-A2]